MAAFGLCLLGLLVAKGAGQYERIVISITMRWLTAMANHTRARCMRCYNTWIRVYLENDFSPSARCWNAVSVYDGSNSAYWAHCRRCGHKLGTTYNIGLRYSRGPVPGPLPQMYRNPEEYEF